MYPDTSVDTINKIKRRVRYAIMSKVKVDFSTVYDINNLIEAFNKCKKDSIWKESVQRYEMNLLKNIYQVHNELMSGTYKPRGFYEFTIYERGKRRRIKAVNIYDRVVIRSFCDNVLTPVVRNALIYDNGASVKDKGIDFSRRRFDTHLHKFYRENQSNEGYILLIDFSKFFDNIRHDKLIQELERLIDDRRAIEFLKLSIDLFKVDVSYMTDEEYENCMDVPFNSIKYSEIDRSLLTGEKFMYKSIGIGSQISQIAGLLYTSRIDNYCKIVRGVKYYGRYMDDTYVIHEDKEYLRQLLSEIRELCKEYGVFINEDKTQIVKLSHGFKFLQLRYIFTDSGKIIKKISKESIARERRKLKKYHSLLLEGKMDYKEIECAYKSWKGNAKKYSAFHTIQNMDKLFDELFIKPFLRGEK